MEFEMGSQVSQSFSFETVLKKIKRQNFLKNFQNALFWGPFGQNKSKTENSA